MEGFISGFVGTLLTHPLEVLKVKTQINNQKIFNSNFLTNGNILTNGNFLKNGNFLTNGIFLNPTIYGLHYLIYFNVYNELKNNNFYSFSAAFTAQGTSSLILNSLWVIRTKKMGLGMSYSNILKDFNISYFYRGLGYTNLICLQTSTTFGIMDYLNTVNDNPTINAFLSKTISGIIYYPFDTIKNVIRSETNVSSNELLFNLSKEGFLRFYRGLSFYLIKSVPSFVIVNFIYSKLI
jgi:hypothetical protein